MLGYWKICKKGQTLRAAITELIHLLFVLPVYVILILLGLSIRGWVRPDSAIGRYRHHWLGLAVLVYAGSIPAIPNWLVGKVEHTYDAPLIPPGDSVDRPYILVLSGGWFRPTEGGYEIKLGENSFERTLAAVDLWKRTGGKLLFSGAPLPDLSDSVAQRMATLAMRMGVPEAQIVVEGTSRNTHENLAFCEQKFQLSRKKPVILVTSALHLVRSAAIAKQLGIDVIPYPVDFRSSEQLSWQLWIPSNEAAMAFEEVLHEIVGLAAYKIRGWA